MTENEIGSIVIDTCIHIHRELGPGLLESVYEVVLSDQLSRKGLNIKRQVSIPISFLDLKFEEGFKADIVINEMVILELKSVSAIKQVHKKQLLTYLRLSNYRLGYLLNFNEALMKRGITRVVNGIED